LVSNKYTGVFEMHVKKKSVAKKDTANFQCFISQKQKELQEKKIVFNFFTSPPTTDIFFDMHFEDTLYKCDFTFGLAFK
jgi:hypothetical protein